MGRKFYPESTINQVRDAADLQEVISDEILMKKKGKDYVGTCPKCRSSKFTYASRKQLWKCFRCDWGGNDPFKFLMQGYEKTFPEAVEILAAKYGVQLEVREETNNKDISQKVDPNHNFRSVQLRLSGIDESDQQIMKKTKDGEIQTDRYTSGSVDKSFNVVPGDDMILHYYGLDRRPLTYKPKHRKKEVPYIRVRHKIPAHHKNKDGKEMKYRAPYGSDNKLWIPNAIIRKYEAGGTIDTLVFCEGEKKADKITKENIPALAISGIHNFNPVGEMVHQIGALIRDCKVKNVVFMLDADWDELKAKAGKDVSIRPKTFCSAVIKFRDYFAGFAQEGLNVQSYFGYHNSRKQKGIDDYMVANEDKSEEIRDSFFDALISRTGDSDHFTIHKISTLSDYRIREFWKIHNRTAFFEANRDVLKDLEVIKYNGILYRMNDEGEFEMNQKIMPYEQFWKTEVKNDKVQYHFDYVNITRFLKNRGFGLYTHSLYEYTFIHVNNKIVRDVSSHYIQKYVANYIKDDEKKEVLELLYRGGNAYLGADKLTNMDYISPEIHQPKPDTHYFYFPEKYWEITAEGITEHPYSDLRHNVWDDHIIDANPSLLDKQMVDIFQKEDGNYRVRESAEAAKSDMFQFFVRSSMFFWRKNQMLVEDPETGERFYADRDDKEEITMQNLDEMHTNISAKILAAGYVLHDYLDHANLKAIVCIDEKESPIGRAEGGTGKSIWSLMFEHLIKTHVIDGKQPNLTNDNFIYDGVDEKTQAIVFDDCRVNLDFEFFFSQITRGMTINAKGQSKFKTGPKKMIFNTNNMLNGSGNSFERRQYTLAFSDYYNKYRTPKDDFDRLLFHEWPGDQWEKFFNLMACCVQQYLKFGLSIEIPKRQFEARKIRQVLGEDFLDWADLFFDPSGPYINQVVELNFALEEFYQEYPQQRRYTKKRVFKSKLKEFCRYANYEFNPQRKGADEKRIKKGNVEYFTIANADFNANTAQIISETQTGAYGTF